MQRNCSIEHHAAVAIPFVPTSLGTMTIAGQLHGFMNMGLTHLNDFVSFSFLFVNNIIYNQEFVKHYFSCLWNFFLTKNLPALIMWGKEVILYDRK